MEFNCPSLSRHRALYISMENPEIQGRIKMKRFIPVEIFRKKSNTFRGITLSPFSPFVRITSARLHVERKRKIYRYFVNGTTQSRSCFRCQKNTSTIWRKFFTEISVQMVSAHSIISVSDSNLFTTYVLFITRHGYYALLGILGHRRIEKSLDTWNVTRNAKQRRTNKSWLFFSFSGLCPFLPFLNCS